MNDHAKAAARLLSLAGDESDDRHATRQVEAATGYALLAIADAIRGLTPNTPPAATGDDLAHSQAEPGQVDGGGRSRTTRGDFPCCASHIPRTLGPQKQPPRLDDHRTHGHPDREG